MDRFLKFGIIKSKKFLIFCNIVLSFSLGVNLKTISSRAIKAKTIDLEKNMKVIAKLVKNIEYCKTVFSAMWDELKNLREHIKKIEADQKAKKMNQNSLCQKNPSILHRKKKIRKREKSVKIGKIQEEEKK